MKFFAIFEAKNRFSELLAAVAKAKAASNVWAGCLNKACA